MKFTTSKSKNAESFYISKSFINDKGVSTSVNVRKLGTLADLLKEHGPTGDDVMKWARAEAKFETQKYKEDKIVNFSFNSSKRLQPQQQVFYRVGYLFLQYFYYKLGLHKVCRKIRDKYNFKFDINSILSDLIYSRILEPSGKRSSYSCSMGFLEPPSYQLQLERDSTKKERRNPNNPARFLGIIAVTDDGEKANIHNYLNTEK